MHSFKKIFLLPILPFKSLLFFIQEGAQTTKVAKQVLFVFSIFGLCFSFVAGLFLLNFLVQIFPSLKEIGKQQEIMMGVVIVLSMTPFLFFSVLQGSVVYRILRKIPNVQLKEIWGSEIMNKLTQFLYLFLAIIMVMICINLSALGLLIVGGSIAFVISFFILVIYLILIMASLGTVLIQKNESIWNELGEIWDLCTFARHFFNFEGQMMQLLDQHSGWVSLISIVLVYGIPTTLAMAIWIHRKSFLALQQ